MLILRAAVPKTSSTLRARWAPRAALACTLVACGADPLGPRRDVSGPIVETNRVSYSWSVEDEVIWRVMNPHGSDVFYFRGGHVYMERHARGRWHFVELYGSSGGELRRLEQGQVLSANLKLTNPPFPHSGWYRISARLYRDSALTKPWPPGNRVSQVFWVGP